MPLPHDGPQDVFTNLTGTMDAARQVIADVGLRLYRVFFVIERWSGARIEEGTLQATRYEEILPPPDVRHLLASRIASSGGVYEDGAVLLSKITRSLTREQLLGLTESGDQRPRNERFSYGLLPRGQALVELFKPTGRPTLEPLAWSIALNPTNRRIQPPVRQP